jgi:glutathione S-transferase
MAGDRVTDVADGRDRPFPRPGASFPARFNKGKAPYAEERYSKEARRLYGVLDKRLEDREFICDDYSIADMATWPWIARDRHERVPECKALVPDDARPAGGAEGLSGSEGYGPDPYAIISRVPQIKQQR